MPFDLIIRNGRVVQGSEIVESDIAIQDGVIAAIGPQLSRGGKETIDATDLLVMPGLIDPHVHFNDPGHTDWEGIATDRARSPRGGGVLYFDMPLNSSPPTISGIYFDEKLRVAEKTSHTDFALWGGIVPGNLDQMEQLAERGVVGFKAFMADSGFPAFGRADDETLWEGMQRAAQLNLPVAVHAENNEITAACAKRVANNGKVSMREYLDSRPIIAELEAIQRAIFFAAEAGCALHIVHVSSAEGVALVTAARRYCDVTCETCPHYLVFSDKDAEKIGAAAKCAPPLRTAAERDNLWAELALGGGINFVASDHSPSLPSMKTGNDFFKIWGGITGVQTTLPTMLTEGYSQREIPIERIVALTSSNTAERFKLPKKGKLRVDFDADITLIDMRDEYELNADALFYKHKTSPFVGRNFRGRIKRTFLRGQTVFADGKIVGPPIGKLVKPVRPKE